MRLSKAQAAVIITLNIIIAALVAVIFVLPAFTPAAAPERGEEHAPANTNVPDDEPPPHEKLRAASAGACPDVARETRLMGSGDETAVAVYFRDGTAYVFGNATVKGLDFDSYGGFLCVVNAAGTILSYTYFEGRITAVGIVAGGYAVCAGEKLYYADYTGAASVKAALDGAGVDAMTVDGDKIAVVTQPNDNTLKLTEYSTPQGEWTRGRSTRISSGYAVKYFDCYCFDDSYVIAARAYYTPGYDAAVFYTFRPGGDATAHLYGGDGSGLTRPYAVMPCSAGYFALAAVGGMANIITVDGAFTGYHSVDLGFAFSDARLLHDAGRYYASFVCRDGTVTYELNADLSRQKLPELDGFLPDCAIKAGETLFAGTCTTGTGSSRTVRSGIISPYSQKSLLLDIKGCTVYGGTRTADGLTLVMSATGGSALSAPSGGSDIYIITVRW